MQSLPHRSENRQRPGVHPSGLHCLGAIAWRAPHTDAARTPLQNGYIDSFNGNFREKCHDECCSGYGFETLSQARSTMASWRQNDNQVRPLSGLGQMPPAAFAQRHRIINQTPSACRQEIK